MSHTQKVAVIGLGNIGKALATDLIKGKRKIIVASKNYDDAVAFAANNADLIESAHIGEAVKAADIVIPTVWFNVEQEFVQQFAGELKGKIIIDVSNPIAPDENGGFKKIIDQNQSSGQIINDLVGNNAKVVKTFGTLGVESLANAAHQQPAKVMFYATDHSDVSDAIEVLIRDAGFEALNVGTIDQSIRIEVFGDLHEFGALGKPSTLEEVKGKI
ncbi:NADPH-dependent F420 reductase [Epilithonimonas hungarica]|uniref:Pyrroline-5-carboxylate reductase catalytic N-terminal domain-containing protein n=1 Tax=Epilithonimonas hungarica TaxID=454006 RepID=A0A1G7SRC5_9FLAO|nr:NAD(P)-binding domain-containing protein [Epilithonimonas hungarica]SDG25615.1 hypothetical protein SAMN05421825_3057 [Epilithonimonas hungarica]